tara:strand:- start:109 stop:846 length:738 start_codon:yes stop_codon:yes gene_type:complete
MPKKLTRQRIVYLIVVAAGLTPAIAQRPAGIGSYGGGSSSGSGSPFTYLYIQGIDQNTVGGANVSWPSTGGAGPTLIPVEGASSGDVTTAASATTVSYLSFTKNASNATANSIQVKTFIPSTWATSTKTATVDVRFRAVATSGNALFQVSAQCFTPPAVPGSFSSAVSMTAKAVGGTTLQWVDTATTTLTASDVLAGCTAGDQLWIRFWRQGNSGSDTLSTGTCTLAATGTGCAEVATIKIGVAQ